MSAFSESVVEDMALAWLESQGWIVRHGADITPEMAGAGRTNSGQVALQRRLRDALLPKLIADELCVKDPVRLLEGVVA